MPHTIHGAPCGAALCLVAFVVLSSPARAQVAGLGGTLVVTNKSTASASIIDVATGRLLATLPTGDGPHEVALSDDGRTAVVTDYGAQTPGSTLTVIDVPSRNVTRTIQLGEHRRPHGIAFLPGDSLVAVTSEVSGNVVLVRVADGTIVKTIPTQQQGSHMLAFGERADHIYTGNIGSNTVSELDVAAGTFVRTFDVPAEPEAIGMPPDGSEVWVGSNATGVVSVLDPETGEVTSAAEGFGWPYRIVFTPDGTTVLLPDLRGEELRILERTSHREIARLPFEGAAPQGITLTPDGRYAFLSLSQQGRVAIIDLGTNEVVAHIDAGATPDGVVYVPEGISPADADQEQQR